MEIMKTGGRTVRVFPADTDLLIAVHCDAETAECLAHNVSGATIAAVDGVDWNHDLTPWPANPIFRGQPDFGGGAGAYLAELTQSILPEAEAMVGRKPSSRMIAGYSLAGMFALYAAMEWDGFEGAASVSGSLWYEDFAGYACGGRRVPELAYFSVGAREKSGRNRAFHGIEDRTREIEACFSRRGCRTILEINPGGHFDDPPGRMIRAVQWMIRMKNER